MQEDTTRQVAETKRAVREVQVRSLTVVHDYQNALENGFDVTTRAFHEMNKGFQTIASEVTSFSKRRLDDAVQAWEQVIRARNFGEVVEAQTWYAQKAFDAYSSEISKLGDLYLGIAHDAAKRFEQAASKRS